MIQRRFLAFMALALLCLGLSGCTGGPGGASNTEMISRYNKDLPPDDGKGPGMQSPERSTMPMKGQPK